jgi:hypothetical protein
MVTKREKPKSKPTRRRSPAREGAAKAWRPPRRRKDEPHLLYLARLGDALPDDTVARLPIDGSEQLDHYVYGTAKRKR